MRLVLRVLLRFRSRGHKADPVRADGAERAQHPVRQHHEAQQEQVAAGDRGRAAVPDEHAAQDAAGEEQIRRQGRQGGEEVVLGGAGAGVREGPDHPHALVAVVCGGVVGDVEDHRRDIHRQQPTDGRHDGEIGEEMALHGHGQTSRWGGKIPVIHIADTSWLIGSAGTKCKCVRVRACARVCVCANRQLPRVGGDSIHALLVPVAVL